MLEKAGLERIDADGRPFDPNEHEAVLQDDGDGEPRVAATMRTGYRLNGRVLRPAMVRVTRVASLEMRIHLTRERAKPSEHGERAEAPPTSRPAPARSE